jgi:carbonic anhydrase
MSSIMGGATRIIQGIQHFQERVFSSKKSLFHRLGGGQQPLALFITCSDSRINPNLLTQTEPGELFILRNAGNLVPPHGGGVSGSAATLEYALKVLNIRDVIVCGHSQCGAMQGLLTPESLRDLPAVRSWLTHAQDILPAIESAGAGLAPADKLMLAIERNVLLQLEHVKSYPFVTEALAAGQLRLHGWVYIIETGQVTAHVSGKERFEPLLEAMQRGEEVAVSSGPVNRRNLGDSM